jgi:cell filamentation protein
VSRDKYGVGNDLYCYPGTTTLKNLLDIRDDAALSDAERDLTSDAADTLDFISPPYDLDSLKAIHRHLFARVYPWSGELRSVDISKGSTRFCTAVRIQPEAEKFFESMKRLRWLEGLSRHELIANVAESFGDFNVIHPFREGNGRAQRILFENLIINAGFEITWHDVDPDDWITANVAAYNVNYGPITDIFARCIGGMIGTAAP